MKQSTQGIQSGEIARRAAGIAATTEALRQLAADDAYEAAESARIEAASTERLTRNARAACSLDAEAIAASIAATPTFGHADLMLILLALQDKTATGPCASLSVTDEIADAISYLDDESGEFRDAEDTGERDYQFDKFDSLTGDWA